MKQIVFLKPKHYKSTLLKWKTLQALATQSKFKFSFMPLGELVLPERSKTKTPFTLQAVSPMDDFAHARMNL